MKSHQTATHHPTAQCRAYAALLPILDEPGIDPDALAEARAHLDTCAYCQQQRAAYRQLETAAYQYLSPPSSPRYQTEEIMRDLLGEPATAPGEIEITKLLTVPHSPRKPASARRLITGLVPLAAVLVIVVITVTLFANRARPGGTGGNTASPSSPSWSQLRDISMVSATEGWAAGFTGPCTATFDECQATDPLLMHYQGGKWTSVRLSFKGPLNTISMLSATDGWAGGGDIILHYDGHTWKQMPNSQQLTLNDLHMLSDIDGWAIGSIGGTQAILHYDGTAWTAQPLPASLGITQQHFIEFDGLDMISPTEGWVVGTLYVRGALNTATPTSRLTNPTAVVLHYANRQWSVQSSTPSAGMDSISMTSATDGWAVGSAGTGDPSNPHTPPTSVNDHPFLLHYAQGKWTQVTTLNNTEGSAWAVSMDSASDGWAAGPEISAAGNGPTVTSLLHYNGQQWTPVPALVFQHKDLLIMNIHMLSATDGWAVGTLQTNSGQARSNDHAVILSLTTLIVHFHNGTWSIFPTP